MEKAEISIESRVGKKLCKAKTLPCNQVLCFGKEYYEPCIAQETDPIDDVDIYFPKSVIVDNKISFDAVNVTKQVKYHQCPLRVLQPKAKVAYQEVYIRPLIKLHCKTLKQYYENLQTEILPATTRAARAQTEVPFTASSMKPKNYGSRYLPPPPRTPLVGARARSEYGERRHFVSVYH